MHFVSKKDDFFVAYFSKNLLFSRKITYFCSDKQIKLVMRQYKSNFVRTAMQYATVLMLGLMLLVGPASCKKDPQPNPTPNVPNDTITPVIPGDTIVPPIDTIQPGGDTIVPGGDTIVPTPPTAGKVANFYYDGGVKLPPLDSIRKYANDPEYDTIYIKWCVGTDAYWTPHTFIAVSDSLDKRFRISTKVYGAWVVIPYQILPDADSTNIGVKGMVQSNRDWYESKHYTVSPIVGDKHAKATTKPTYYNGNRVLTSGRSR